MPGSACRVFNSAEEYIHTIRAAHVQAAILKPGQFKGELTRIDLHQLWLQRGEESLARSLHISIPKTRVPIFFLTDSEQPPTSINGIEVRAGELTFWGRESEQYQRTDAAMRWGAMSLVPDELARAALTILGREIPAPIETQVLRPEVKAMQSLTTLHRIAGTLAKSAPEIIAHAEVARSLEQAMVHAMLHAIDRSERKLPAPGYKTRHAILEGLEAFIARHAGHPVYIMDLCSELGAPERTVRRVFNEQFGLSPMRYLWLRRMYLTNRALQLAEPENTSVTEIAVEHGFAELGRFAASYRDLFGESPSVTLRKAPDFIPRPMPPDYAGLARLE